MAMQVFVTNEEVAEQLQMEPADLVEVLVNIANLDDEELDEVIAMAADATGTNATTAHRAIPPFLRRLADAIDGAAV